MLQWEGGSGSGMTVAIVDIVIVHACMVSVIDMLVHHVVVVVIPSCCRCQVVVVGWLWIINAGQIVSKT